MRQRSMKYWKIGRSWVGDGAECSGNSGTERNGKIKRIKGENSDIIAHQQLCAKMKVEWTIEWARKPIAGRYAIADCTPPSPAGSHAFRTLDQHILEIVTQARTGHGHFGEYYQIHNIQEPTNCPCGAGLQTCEHIVFKCQAHEEYGDIIDEGAPDHQLATLFGTKTGINALAEFVRKTKAFQKTQATEIPWRTLDEEPSDQRSRPPARPDRNPHPIHLTQ